MSGTPEERLGTVQARIQGACAAAGRDPAGVRLLAVSKVQPVQAIRDLYALGVRDFGENYAQELIDKAAALADLEGLRWHYIGNLQSNKAGALAGCCAAVHTVASVRAGRALGRRATELGREVEAMLQVNVGREPQKSGVLPEDVEALHAQLGEAQGLRITGLMTIPPAGDLDLARACYRQLADLAGRRGLSELSMGMSRDLETAIACGATWVRIGTDLFGPRD